VSLDILELIVHHDLHVWSCRDVFAEQGRVLFEGFYLSLAIGLAAFRDMAFEFMAGL
jgi:hypothetical protein